MINIDKRYIIFAKNIDEEVLKKTLSLDPGLVFYMKNPSDEIINFAARTKKWKDIICSRNKNSFIFDTAKLFYQNINKELYSKMCKNQ